MAYRGFKDLPRKMTSDKLIRDKLFDFAKNPKYYEYQHEFALIFHRCMIRDLYAKPVFFRLTSSS